MLDQNGQPLNLLLSRSRLIDRNIDELIGICKGVLFDGAVVQAEAEMMLKWMETNRHAADQWPANILYCRIERMLSDGKLDNNEQAELLDLLIETTGPAAHLYNEPSTSTELPLTQPPPPIEYDGRIFCATGKFITGTRDQVTGIIEERLGSATTKPTKKTDYLIIGEVGSRDWIHSTFGRKIEKAVELNNKGSLINIISEQHWVKSL
ncbi:MAG: BRCT domain-containing protein [Gammaproteobacteria bacterium]|nr:BRCT domain-containing protein [Gammaproteobacteria bacterium]